MVLLVDECLADMIMLAASSSCELCDHHADDKRITRLISRILVHCVAENDTVPLVLSSVACCCCVPVPFAIPSLVPVKLRVHFNP
jgi:hypothetical protein